MEVDPWRRRSLHLGGLSQIAKITAIELSFLFHNPFSLRRLNRKAKLLAAPCGRAFVFGPVVTEGLVDLL